MDASAIVVDELYVVSDLHLGGEAPFQIFREAPALAGLIDSLHSSDTASAPCRRALVINGDFVDFLAERPARHFDAEGAVQKLRRIVKDAAFAPVFHAITRFIGVPHHRLAIVLGNHDVELALAWVRQELEWLLCRGDEASQGRIIWSLDGEGVLLRIGSDQGPRVMCAHGNEVDAWNVVSHEDIRRISRDGLRERNIASDYIPNAGSRMVIEVMNAIKQRYPFVDLLKPETQSVIPTLLALDPAAAAALRSLPAVVSRQQIDRLRIATGFLRDEALPQATDGPSPRIGPEDSIPPLCPPTAPERIAAREQMSLALLDKAEEGFRDECMPIDLLNGTDFARTLGLGSAVLAFIRTGDRAETLRAQLRELAEDRSFSLTDRDTTFVAMNERVSTNIDFLVTGHTHLARAIERETTRAFYFNTGTWARVFQVGDDALRDQQKFAELLETLSAGSIEALDACAGLVAVRPHLAAFWCEGAAVHGELRTVPAQPPYRSVAVDGTRFTRK